jgi:hypothetical protein
MAPKLRGSDIPPLKADVTELLLRIVYVTGYTDESP